MHIKAKTKSPKETQRLGEKFAKNLEGGEVIALYGDLGAGKTVFVQGLAKGLGIISSAVCSERNSAVGS